jgi:hypothetical protein
VSLVEQVKSYEEYSIPKAVYTIVVLTTLPRDKSIFYSAAMSDLDSFVLDKDRQGEKLGMYKHKLIFLHPRLVSSKTPEGIRPWLELIKDSLDEKIDETQYKSSLFQGIIQEIQKNTISPEDAARIKDEAAWENSKQEEFEKGLEKGEKLGIEKGKVEGEKLGIEKGEKLGIEKGEKLGIEKGKVETLLEIKLEEKSLVWIKKIHAVSDVKQLEQIKQAILQAKTPQKLESLLKKIL